MGFYLENEEENINEMVLEFNSGDDADGYYEWLAKCKKKLQGLSTNKPCEKDEAEND